MAAVSNGSDIGVPQIPPRTGANWQGGRRVPETRKDRDDHSDESASQPERAPAPPGTGNVLDLVV
jgi:hypothetical protein